MPVCLPAFLPSWLSVCWCIALNIRQTIGTFQSSSEQGIRFHGRFGINILHRLKVVHSTIITIIIIIQAHLVALICFKSTIYWSSTTALKRPNGITFNCCQFPVVFARNSKALLAAKDPNYNNYYYSNKLLQGTRPRCLLIVFGLCCSLNCPVLLIPKKVNDPFSNGRPPEEQHSR